MKHLTPIMKTLAEDVFMDNDCLLALIHPWEDTDEHADGIYLRIRALGDDKFSVVAEAHIGHALNPQPRNPSDFSYPSCADNYFDVDDFVGRPVCEILSFFDGCNHVKRQDDAYIFDIKDVDFVAYWTADKAPWVYANRDHWYLFCPSKPEMKVVLQAAQMLADRDWDYAMTTCPNDERPILRIFPHNISISPEPYIDMTKTGANQFRLTAYEDGWVQSKKLNNFFDTIRVCSKMSRDKESLVFPIESLLDIIAAIGQ